MLLVSHHHHHHAYTLKSIQWIIAIGKSVAKIHQMHNKYFKEKNALIEKILNEWIWTQKKEENPVEEIQMLKKTNHYNRINQSILFHNSFFFYFFFSCFYLQNVFVHCRWQTNPKIKNRWKKYKEKKWFKEIFIKNKKSEKQKETGQTFNIFIKLCL